MSTPSTITRGSPRQRNIANNRKIQAKYNTDLILSQVRDQLMASPNTLPKVINNAKSPSISVSSSRSSKPRTPAPKPSKMSKSSSGFDVGAAVSDAIDILTKSMSNTYIIASVLIVAVVVISHGPTLNTGPFRDYINTNKVNNTILTWIDSNALKFYGFLTFFPALYSIPSNTRTVATFATFLWVLLVPEYTVFEYIIQSVALYIFFKTNKMNTRTIVVLITIVAYYLGYLALAPASVTAAPPGCYDPSGNYVPQSTCANMRVCYGPERNVIPCPGRPDTTAASILPQPFPIF